MNIYLCYDLLDYYFPFKVSQVPKYGAYQCKICGGEKLLVSHNANNHSNDYCCPLCLKPCIHSHNPEEHNEFNSCKDRFNCPNHLYICPDEEWFKCQKCDDLLCCHSEDIHYCHHCQIMFKCECLHGTRKKTPSDPETEVDGEIWHAGLIHQIFKDGQLVAHGMPIFQSVPEYWELITKGYDFQFTCSCFFQKEYQNCFKKRLQNQPYNNPCILCHNKVPHNHDHDDNRVTPDFFTGTLLSGAYKHEPLCKLCPNEH